jgi:hypothetical protein
MTQFIKCTHCKTKKLFTEFYRDHAKRNGRKSWCRQCVKTHKRIANRARRELKRTWGIVAEYQGKPFTAVYVAPYGFTPEATRQGVKR